MSRRVIVVGGGLAGMAAAVALEAAGGVAVTLLEAGRRLGGRASSFRDPQTGEELDNCQHVLLGCCTNLIDFYRRIGVGHLIGWEPTVRFVDGAGRAHALRGTAGLPAPLHLGPSLLKFSALTWGERARLSVAMLAMMRLGRAGREALAHVPFGEWLTQHGQPPSLVHKLYAPILVGALNEEVEQANASYAIQVLQESLLTNAGGYVLGLPACPLSQLYGSLPCRDVRLGARVAELRFEGRRVLGVVLASGEALAADAVVLATNHHTLGRFVPAELAAADVRFRRLDRLESVPILGAHLAFDRPVLSESHVAFMDGPLQWLFRKDADGRNVHGVISAAREWVDRPREECLGLFTEQVRRMLPGARDAQLLRGTIVVEKRATFAAVPGVDELRPAQGPPPGGLSNVYLSGDYTKTGWPSTMEGAVRSGYLAAEAVMEHGFAYPGWGAGLLVADLPVQWPGQLLELATGRDSS